MQSYDVIVAGIGAMGSSTLYHLAKKGLRVAGLDPFQPGHDRGSSHGETRIIRKAYFLHPDYVPLLERSYDLWRDLEAETGSDLLQLTGLLCIGEEDSTFIQGLKRCFEVNNLPHEKLTSAETTRRYPEFQVPESHVVYFDPEGGYLKVENCVQAHAAMAQKHGADIFSGESLLSWEPDGDGVRITTSKRELYAGRLVITTGAWVAPEFAALGVSLKVRRKVLFWHHLTRPGLFKDTPVWIWKNQGSDFYGFPSLNGGTMKSAEDTGGDYLNQPEDRDFSIKPEDDAALTPFLHRAFPGMIGAVESGRTCLYTDAADKNFIIGFHPEHAQVLLASCCSGHGFKLSTAIGEVLADGAINGRLSRQVDFLSLARLIPDVA